MSETKEMTLSEILTAPQFKMLLREVNRLTKEGIQPMEPEFAKRLKSLFKPWADELQAKGVVSEYLAYVVCYLVQQNKL